MSLIPKGLRNYGSGSKSTSRNIVAINLARWHPNGEASYVQDAYVSWHETPFKCFFGGYNSGKSFSGSHDSVLAAAHNPGVVGGVIGPTMPHVRRVMIPTLEFILNECWEVTFDDGSTGPMPYVLNQSKWELTLPLFKNAKMSFTFADEDNLKGQNWRWGWGDEPGLWEEGAFNSFNARVRVAPTPQEVLRGAYRQIGLTGTPEGINWLYHRTVGNENNNGCLEGTHPNLRVWYAKTQDAVWAPPDWLQNLIETLPEDEREAKLNGRFTANSRGHVYNFDRTKHVKHLDYDPNYPLTISFDWGRSPIVMVVHQTIGTAGSNSRVIHALDEIQFERGTIADVVYEFAKRWKMKIGYNDINNGYIQPIPIVVCGDATGKSMGATGVNAWADLFDRLASHDLRFTDKKLNNNPTIRDRVAVVNAKLDNGRYFISPKCRLLAKSFELTYWNPLNANKLLKPVNDDPTHLSDAAGYDIFREYGKDRIQQVNDQLALAVAHNQSERNNKKRKPGTKGFDDDGLSRRKPQVSTPFDLDTSIKL